MRTDQPDRIPVPAGDFAPVPLDATDRRHPVPWEWWDAIAIYLVWILLYGPAVALVAQVAPGATADGLETTIVVGLALLIGTTIGWLALRGWAARTPSGVRIAFGPKAIRPRDLLTGIAFGVAAFVVFQIGLGVALTQILDLAGQPRPQVQQEVQQAVQGSGQGPLLVAFAVALLAPIGEELLFRGVLYQALAKHLPGWPALGLSGLLFGLTHREPFVIAVTFPLGMFLAWMLRRTGTLVVPITAHAVFNLVGVVAIRASAGA